MEIVFLSEGANHSDSVSWLNPQLLRPPADKCHSEENRALNKALQDWMTILVHGGTQFQFHHRSIVLLPLVEFDPEEGIIIVELFEITLTFEL